MKKEIFKKIGILFLYFLIVLATLSGALANELVNATQDTFVSVILSNDNFGNLTYVTTKLDDLYTYLEFPISQIPKTNETHTVTINEGLVCLWLYYVSTVAGDYTTMYYLNNTFDESILVYNDNYEQYWMTCFTETLFFARATHQFTRVCFNMTDALEYAHSEDLDYIDFVLKSDADLANYFEYDSKENIIPAQHPYFSYNYIITEDGIEPEEPEPKLFSPIDFNNTSNVIFLFVLVFAFLGTMTLGFMFKNFGFVSLGFFIGIVVGFMLSGFHIFLTLCFIFLDISIFINFAKQNK